MTKSGDTEMEKIEIRKLKDKSGKKISENKFLDSATSAE